MAVERHIECPFCPDDVSKLYIPASWSADYAMTWFHAIHLAEHVEEMLCCQPCVQAMYATDVPHRPCFEPDCQCDCSHTTTPERTAHADG